MSYIAFDLDALNAAPNVARAARVSEDTIIGGLLRLWAHAFRCKADVLDELEVRGCFDSAADVMPALKAFGFLAEAPKGKIRVRGAERYLRISEARSKGGKAASGNLKRGTLQPGCQPELVPGYSPAPAGTQPGVSPGYSPALTPSTEHLAPNTESKSIAPLFASPTPEPVESKPKPPRDSELLQYDFKLVTGSEYRWNGAKDGVALADLLKTSTLDEVRTRWRRGLEAPANAWASCRTVAQLRQKWNDLVPATVAGPPKSTRDDTGPVRAIVHTRWPTS